MGLSVRTALEIFMRASGWIPFMVTLTCNPAWFQSPEDAYFFCRKFTGKLVQELRRRNGQGRCGVGGGGVRLRSDHYFVGFELHKSGWPHWHIVLDGSFCDIDVLRQVWNSFGQRHGKPGIGHVFFTEKKTHWTIEMAIAYCHQIPYGPSRGWLARLDHAERKAHPSVLVVARSQSLGRNCQEKAAIEAHFQSRRDVFLPDLPRRRKTPLP
ncbi:MAG: hypothetical protein ACT452_05205 [Microthrixaceae bacterium]